MAKATSNSNGATTITEPLAANPISPNPALVEFPQDVWGFTSELRKAGIRAGQAIRGDAEKLSLYLAHLRILALHVKARFDGDVAELADRAAEIEFRAIERGEHLRGVHPTN